MASDLEERIKNVFQILEAAPDKISTLGASDLPDDLKWALNVSAKDAEARKAGLWAPWSSFARVLEIASTDMNDPETFPIRYINALIMYAKNVVVLMTTRNEESLLDSSFLKELPKFLKRLLAVESKNGFYRKAIKNVVQFYCNFFDHSRRIVSSSRCSLVINAGIDLFTFTATELQKFLELSITDSGFEIAYLMQILTNSLSDGSLPIKLFLSETSFGKFLDAFLSYGMILEQHEENEKIINMLGIVIKCLFQVSCFFSLLENGSLGARTTLAKLLDMDLPIIFDGSENVKNCSDLADISIFLLNDTETIAKKRFPDSSNKVGLDPRDEWHYVLASLELVEGSVTISKTVKKDLIDRKLVSKIVEILILAEKYLPKKNKLQNLGELDDTGKSSEERDPYEFPLIKSPMVHILSVCVQGNESIQNEIRELHGLEIILANCSIDINNPFVNQRAILCLRYLLANNAANQDFVAKLEAKEAVQTDALKEAGYEVDITDGKVKLKKAEKASSQSEKITELEPN